MFRFLCIPLLALIALPVSAQDESTPSPPVNPFFLKQMWDELTSELQQNQRLLGVISPNDAQFTETLKARQADLTKQLRDVMQQLQTFGGSNIGENSPVPVIPLAPQRAVQELNHPNFSRVPQEMSVQPLHHPSHPNIPAALIPAMPQYDFPPGGSLMFPSLEQQDQNWESPHWGPRLPKELTEVKLTVETLRKEVAELKDTIKALETQIQLLNRNILLSEKARERENGR